MSLILDALNRADRERSEQRQMPNVHAAPLATPPAPRPVLRWLVEGLLVVTVLAVVVYLFIFPRQDEQASAAADTEKAPALPVTISPPITRSPQPAKPDQANNGATPGINSAAATGPALSQRAVAQAGSENSTIAQLYQQNTRVVAETKTRPNQIATVQTSAVTTKATTTAKATTAPTIKPAAQASSSKERSKPSAQDILQQIPLLTSLSRRFQQSIPNIDYSAHLYNDQDGSGVVKLNGALRKIGSEPAPGLRVIAILPNSVVLSYNGIQFRLLALNSWINYQ